MHCKEFKYSDTTGAFFSDDTFVAVLPSDILGETNLLDLLYDRLVFPGWFGFNWNALFDCLRDFSWIEEKKIILIHTSLPELPPAKMRIYLEILFDAMNAWETGGLHELDVVFPTSAKSEIEKLR